MNRYRITIGFFASFLLAFALSAAAQVGTTGKVHPWSIKTDLLGFRSHSISLEGEVRLFWRVSAFGQVGYIEGNKHDGYWRSYGYLGRVGFQFWLGSKEAARSMNGFAIRCEAARRVWHSNSIRNKMIGQTDAAGFVGLSYTWNPFDRLVLEPCLGVGMSKWRESFNDPNLLGASPGIPNTPWFHPGSHNGSWLEYDSEGDLVALRGRAFQINIGLLVGIRL